MPWLWAGVVMMAAGGETSLTDRRLRVGAQRERPALDPATSPDALALVPVAVAAAVAVFTSALAAIRRCCLRP